VGDGRRRVARGIACKVSAELINTRRKSRPTKRPLSSLLVYFVAPLMVAGSGDALPEVSLPSYSCCGPDSGGQLQGAKEWGRLRVRCN